GRSHQERSPDVTLQAAEPVQCRQRGDRAQLPRLVIEDLSGIEPGVRELLEEPTVFRVDLLELVQALPPVPREQPVGCFERSLGLLRRHLAPAFLSSCPGIAGRRAGTRTTRRTVASRVASVKST